MITQVIQPFSDFSAIGLVVIHPKLKLKRIHPIFFI